jgi:hypothetical protein
MDLTAETKAPTIKNNALIPAEASYVKDEPEDGILYFVIQENPQPAIQQEDQSDLPFTAGDVVWAYVNGFPLWPSLVTVDREGKIFTKTRSMTYFILIFVH